MKARPITEHSPVRLYAVGLAVLLVAAVAVLGMSVRERHRVRAEAEERQQALAAGPHVAVATAKASPAEQTVVAQGEARPFLSVTLYAKVSGYLREMRVDKGDPVKKDQVLAVLESPEIDRQYQAAVADARTKRATAKRAENLVGPGVVSVQDADVARAQAEVAEATVETQGTLRGYEVLRAPFDGVVTARYADPGALVQAATGAQTGALAVVTVSQLDTLRVYAYLPQSEAAFVKVGDPAEITTLERPGQPYPGTVTRVSGELDPRTRMMLVEVDMDNHKREIMPGGFVQVALKIHTPSYVQIPSSALVVRGDKTVVAVIGDDDRVHFQPVKVATDDGITARLLEGVEAGATVALELGENVQEGARVQPVQEARKGQG